MPLPPVWRGNSLFYDRSGVGNHSYSLFGGIASEMEVNGRRVELSVLDLNFCEVSCSLDERVYVFISDRFTISISYLALDPAKEIHTGIGRDGMALSAAQAVIRVVGGSERLCPVLICGEMDRFVACGKNGDKRYGKHNGHDQGCESVLEFFICASSCM